jgi:uncharacterized protein
MPVVGSRGFAPSLLACVTLLACAAIAITGRAGAAPTELFFSEYVEGTSNNKALEIHNGTGAAVNLGTEGYNVQMFFNGNPAAGLTINLTGTVASGDVFVLAHSSASAPILAVADQTNGAGWFNGDDAVVLRKGATIIDSIGQAGFDPGTEWGTGLVSTADNTLRRKSTVEGGDTNATDAFDPAVEWDGFATDTFDGLGNAPPIPPPPFGTCGDGTETSIHSIQGAGLTSPIAGQQRVIEGIVVGDFQGAGAFGGFYVQEEDPDADADPQTSEGIFVFSSSAVTVGDAVRIRGTVIEFSGLTELTTVTDASVCSSGNPLPATTALGMPVSALTDFETTEGMRVSFSQSLVISEYFNYDRFGELVLALPLTGESRAFTPTSIDEPGAPALARAQANSLRRITLDDGLNTQNPDVLRHPNGDPFSLDNRFRGGDTVRNVTGVMDYRFNLYRVQPTVAADYTAANPRPDAPDDVGGDVHVAALNTLNYFLTPDYPAGPLDNTCGPLQNAECRGADFDQPLEFTRQRDKILAALAGLDADVIGLNEIENTTGVDPLGDPTNGIVAGLNGMLGSGTYAAIDTGVIGIDAIRVGLIYKPSVVTPVGDFEILDSGDDPRFRDTLNRPVLAQTFDVVETGARFTVAVNHLKSKGSDCNAVDDSDMGDGQGNCNQTRQLAAEALVDWLATDPTGSGDPDFLIVGDLNSYAQEDPIDAVKAGPDDMAGTSDDYTNLVAAYSGTYAYSYVFDGQAGYLDHALSSANLRSQVTGTTEWHINADEPDVLDYDTSFKPAAVDALYEANAYRSSDHDPVLVGLSLCENVDPTLQVSASPNLLRPPNHRYVTVQATVSASDNEDPDPEVELVSVTSNEPDDGEDDGNTVDDIVIVDDDTFRLRAERSGTGSGRIYTITYRATDDCGNTTVQSAAVSVPVGR